MPFVREPLAALRCYRKDPSTPQYIGNATFSLHRDAAFAQDDVREKTIKNVECGILVGSDIGTAIWQAERKGILLPLLLITCGCDVDGGTWE